MGSLRTVTEKVLQSISRTTEAVEALVAAETSIEVQLATKGDTKVLTIGDTKVLNFRLLLYRLHLVI